MNTYTLLCERKYINQKSCKEAVAHVETDRAPMSMRSTVISLIAIGLGAIFLGILTRPYDPEASTFLMALGLLLPISSIFFYILYKRSVKAEKDYDGDSINLAFKMKLK